MDGTISMGRTTTDTAVSYVFICINEQPELDFGGQRYAITTVFQFSRR